MTRKTISEMRNNSRQYNAYTKLHEMATTPNKLVSKICYRLMELVRHF